MKYLLLFFLITLFAATIVFNLSKQPKDQKSLISLQEEKSDDEVAPEIQRLANSVKETTSPQLIKDEKKKKRMEKIIDEVSKLEEELLAEDGFIETEQLEEKSPINLKEGFRKNSRVINTPKKQETIKKSPFKYSEDPNQYLRNSQGEYFIQDNLRAISVHSYSKGMGRAVGQAQGYYLVTNDSQTKKFPLVVKKKNRQQLAIMTGVISIKTTHNTIAKKIKKQYQLENVQEFPHLNLYIYKLRNAEDLLSVYRNIKNHPHVDKAELEIIERRVKKL